MTDLHEKESKEDPFSFADTTSSQDEAEDAFGGDTSSIHNSGVPVHQKYLIDDTRDDTVKQIETATEDDFFGGFESSPPPASNVESQATSEVPLASNEAVENSQEVVASSGDLGSFVAADNLSGAYGSTEDTASADVAQAAMERQEKPENSMPLAVDTVSCQSEEEVSDAARLSFQEPLTSHAPEQDFGTTNADFGSFENALESSPSQAAANAPLSENEDGGNNPFENLGESDLNDIPAEQEDNRAAEDAAPSHVGEHNKVGHRDSSDRLAQKENGGHSVGSKEQATPDDLDDNHDDNFGDFGSAELAQVDEDASEQPSANSSGEDDFGEFEDIEPATSQNEDIDNDFGEFGGSAQQGVNDGAADGEPLTEIDASDKDDFGDFGSAQAEQKIGNEEIRVNTNKKQRQHEEIEDDSFGEFGGVDLADETNQKGVDHEADSEDDDFGDFGGANISPPAHESVHAAASVDNQVSEDDFGDFDGAGLSAESNDEQVITVKQSIQDDVDDNFGDFGSAEPVSKVNDRPAVKDDASGDEFGDFSSFDEAEPVKVSSSGPVSSPQSPKLNVSDKALLDRANCVFQRLFGPHLAGCEADSQNDNEMDDANFSVKELLVS